MPVPLLPIAIGVGFLLFGGRKKESIAKPDDLAKDPIPKDPAKVPAHHKSPAEIERDAIASIAGAIGTVAGAVGGTGIGALAAGRVVGGYYLGKYLTDGSTAGGIAGAVSNEALVAEAGASAANAVATALDVTSPGALSIAKVGGGVAALLVWAGFALAALPILFGTIIAVWIADWLELGARTQADAQREFDALRKQIWDAIYPGAIKANPAFGERFAASFVDGYAWTMNRAAFQKWIGQDDSYARAVEGWRTGQFVGLPPLTVGTKQDIAAWEAFNIPDITTTPALDGSFVALQKGIPDREIMRRTLSGTALTRKGDQLPFKFTMALDAPFYPVWATGRFAANLTLFLAWMQGGSAFGGAATKAATGRALGAFEGEVDADGALLLKDPFDAGRTWRYDFADYIAAQSGGDTYSPMIRARNAAGDLYDPTAMSETDSIRASQGLPPQTAAEKEESRHTLK